jgi:hypothetical protein
MILGGAIAAATVGLGVIVTAGGRRRNLPRLSAAMSRRAGLHGR